MSFNASLLLTPLISILTGKIIEAGTGGDHTKIVARATELVAINTALVEINTGNTSGLPALQVAFNTTALSPGEALALQSLLASLSNQVALLTTIAGSTLIGQANTQIFDSVLAAATATAQAYISKDSAAPAPAA
jgi:hypothetical protein